MNLNSFLKGIIYASLALIPILAWYVSESTFFPYIAGKNFSFRFLVEVSFLAWVALAAIEPAYRPKKSLVFYSYSFFLFIIFIANLMGSDPYGSFFSNFERMEGWFTHLHLFLYFTVLYSVYKTNEDWVKMFTWFMVGNILVSLQALLQLFGQKDFLVTKLFSSHFVQNLNSVYPTSMGNNLRLDSTLGNAAYYGIYTLFFIFISVLMAHKANNFKKSQGWKNFIMVAFSASLVLLNKFTMLLSADDTMASTIYNLSSFLWLIGLFGVLYYGYNFAKDSSEGKVGSWPFVIMAVLNTVFLAYTQTRGSYVGLVVGAAVAVYCIVASKMLKKIKQGSARLATGIVMTIVTAVLIPTVLIFGLIFIKDSGIANKFVVLNRLATINVPSLSEATVAIQSYSYPKMLSTFGEITIVSRFLNAKMSIEGWSETTKTKLLGFGQENYTDVFAKHYDPRMYQQEAWFDRAHNVFFDWLVAGGALGLIAYLALYLTPMYMMWLGKSKNNLSVTERAILTGTLVAYFMHNLFVFDFLISLIMFVAILAYVASRTRDIDSHIKLENKVHKQVSDIKIYSALLIGSIITFSLFFFTVFKPLSANLDLISSLRAINSITNYEGLPKGLSAGLKYYKSSINANSFGGDEAAEQMISRVVALSQIDYTKVAESDRAQALKDLAELQQLTEAQLLKGIKNNPSARGYSIYALYLKASNRLEDAKKYSKLAVDMAPDKFSIIFDYIDILTDLKQYDEAYMYAKDIYNKETTFVDAEVKYIIAAARDGKKQEAKTQLESLRLRNPEKAAAVDSQVASLLK